MKRSVLFALTAVLLNLRQVRHIVSALPCL